MESLKTKFILYLVALNCFLAALLIFSWTLIFEKGRSMGGISIAMAMFFLYEMLVILFMESKGDTLNPRQSINLFLGFKAGKIILSLLFIAVYVIFVKVELLRFTGVFIALYLIYLLFDTLYWIRREKSLKAKQYKEKGLNIKKYKLKEIEKLSNYYKK